MTTYGCCVCLGGVFDMWGEKYYCAEHYKEVTQKARERLEDMAKAYSEVRSDVTDNLEIILDGTDDPLTVEARFILARLDTPSGEYTIEYDTLTTMLSDVTDGETKHLRNHKYFAD